MKLVEGKKEITVATSNWPLIEDLFAKMGHKNVSIDEELVVKDIVDITSVLRSWGIPWKQTKWEF